MWRLWSVVFFCSLIACSGDGGAGAADGGADLDAASAGDRRMLADRPLLPDRPRGDGGGTGDYRTPDGFDRSACETTGWDTLALDASIWTIEQTLPGFGPSVVMVRFDGAASALAAKVSGRATAQTTQEAGTLFFYQEPGQGAPLRSFLGCTRPAAGVIDGLRASCYGDGTCILGTFHAVRVERRAGEDEASGNVVKLAEYATFAGSPQTLTANVRVDAARHLAVLARWEDGLRILSLDPGPPYTITARGHAVPEDVPNDFEIYNDVKLIDHNGHSYALMASSSHGMVIYDITNPDAPMLRTHVRNGHNVHSIFLEGTTAYLADLNIGGIVIVDVSFPESPVERSQYVLSGSGGAFVHDLFVEPGRAYLNYWGAGLVILDVTDPTSPQKIGQYTYDRMTNHSGWVTTINGRKVALVGDEDYTAHARAIDVTDPSNITLIGEWGEDRPQVSIHNILLAGDKAYISYYMDGFRMLQLSDTAAPTQIGYFNTWRGDAQDGKSFFEGAIGIDKVGNRIFIADTARGLMVLEVQ